MLSISVSTSSSTTSTIAGTNCGNACAIPCASCNIICTPACKSCGSILSSAAVSFSMICSALSASAGSSFIIPSASAAIMSGATSAIACTIVESMLTSCGNMSVTPSTTPLTPSLTFSAAPSLPASMSLKPSIRVVRDGKSSLTILFLSPVKVPCSLVKLSSKAALAFTASSLITMPYASASCISSLMPSLPLLSNGKSSAALFPNISLAAAFLAVSSSIAASASILSISTVSVLLRLPLASLSDTPSFSNFSPAPAVPFCALPSSSVMFLTPFLRSSMLAPLRSHA